MTWSVPVEYEPGQANGDLLCLLISGGKTELISVPAGAAGTVLVSAGVGSAPAFGSSVTNLLNLTGDGTGVIYGYRQQILVYSGSVPGTQGVLASACGTHYFNAVTTAGNATTTFTLPSINTGTVDGLWYTFTEAGDATGEILISVGHASDYIKCKTSATGTAITTAAGTGIKNTAATNVVGDSITLMAIGANQWQMIHQTGIWASQ